MNKLVFLAILINPLLSNAQEYYLNKKYYNTSLIFETGAGIGAMNCVTDLGGSRNNTAINSINWKNSKLTGSVFAAINYKNLIGLRIEITSGKVCAYDSLLEPVKAYVHGRYERNLSFESPVNEVQLAIEYYPFQHFKTLSKKLIYPYAVLGLGIFSFDPRAKLGEQWIRLQPLHTEGQGFSEYPSHKEYKLSQLNFCAGGGIKYEATATFFFKAEMNYRFLRTDYLDDVSTTYIQPSLFDNYLPYQLATTAKLLYKRIKTVPSDIQSVDGQRGNQQKKDSYFTLLLKCGIVIGKKRQ